MSYLTRRVGFFRPVRNFVSDFPHNTQRKMGRLDIAQLATTSACSGADDVNCDGHVDAIDVLLILRFLSGNALSISQCPAVGTQV